MAHFLRLEQELSEWVYFWIDPSPLAVIQMLCPHDGEAMDACPAELQSPHASPGCRLVEYEHRGALMHVSASSL